ncbi:hypothetical protein ACJMK2_009903 [Sinanodonta woodiana]|uniref:DUF229 domain containing protein n=1 Tax=Sinanodonta woodiana TaxID=1069815 RepID=A0ABD3VDP5_SINWO
MKSKFRKPRSSYQICCSRDSTYLTVSKRWKCFRIKHTRPCLLLCLTVVFFTIFMISTVIVTDETHYMLLSNHNATCKLPVTDPFDPSIMKYIYEPDPIVCSQFPPLMYVDTSGILRINQSTLMHYGLDLFCMYQSIERLDDSDIRFGPEVKFEPPVFLPHFYFRVICRNGKSKVVYDNLHFNFWCNIKNETKSFGVETEESLSIFVFGLDSLSRSQTIRKLPKTYEYMTKKLNIYDFKGFLKVGLNTFPNLIPLLSGKHVEELPADHEKHFFDNMSLIWNQKSLSQYATLFAEDKIEYSTFNMNKQGFRNLPTTYYFRPILLAMEKMKPVFVELFDKERNFCFGHTKKFQLQIDFYKTFLQRHDKKLRFAFSWLNQLSHDNINMLGNGDDSLRDFLMWMKDNGHLEKSILIFLGDHGFRMGDVATTFVGRIENNMPFLGIYLPTFVKESYPGLHRNLLENTRRLISAFDIFETMQDVVHRRFKPNNATRAYRRSRGISLLRPIHAARSCDDAGVPEVFCACYQTISLNTTLNIVQMISQFALDTINKNLKPKSQICAELSIRSIIEANIIPSTVNKENGVYNLIGSLFRKISGISGRYIILIETYPGDGLFEVMIDYENDQKMSLVGEISRLNRYGNQSHCVKDSSLFQFCYCLDLI